MVKYEDFTWWDSNCLEAANKHIPLIDKDVPLEEYLEPDGFIDFLKAYGYRFGKISAVYRKLGIEEIKELRIIRGLACLFVSHYVKRVFE